MQQLHVSLLWPQGKGSDFAAMVQAMRVYVTVDSHSACPSDFLPVGISHYKTLNTVCSH